MDKNPANLDLAADLNRPSADKEPVLTDLSPSAQDGRDQLKLDAPAVTAEPDTLSTRRDVSKMVTELKAQKAEEARRTVAKKAGLPFVRILGYPISPDVLALVPYHMAQKAGVVAYLRAGKKVRLGITNPTAGETTKALKELKQKTSYEFLVAVIGDDSYEYVLKLYEDLPKERREADEVDVVTGDRKKVETEIHNLVDLKAKIKDVPTTKLIDVLLSGAVKIGASDVHIEPTKTAVRVRYRLDGVLQTVAEFPLTVSHGIVSRLKFLAKLKLDISRVPQDGRFTITEEKNGNKREIDIRAATIPAEYGESIVMRLLDRETLNLSIDSLGLTGEPLHRVMHAMKRPQGIILECGPTGSGKTTTLYALLNLLNDPGKKIITLEDPVEYELPGITQSQIQPEHGFDFAEGFRSVLRLDPDIIMIGEVRDETTAEQATQAALTGHVVLSTLHTNDAPTALPRLIDLGVRPFVLSNAINVVIAQRLVRKVCPHCAAEHRPDADTLAEIKRKLSAVHQTGREAIPPEKEWLWLQGEGCNQCGGTGYRGRIGIFEVLMPDEAMEKLAMRQAPAREVRQAARQAGMITMEEDGLIKALTGVTTISEVWRVARDI